MNKMWCEYCNLVYADHKKTAVELDLQDSVDTDDVFVCHECYLFLIGGNHDFRKVNNGT